MSLLEKLLLWVAIEHFIMSIYSILRDRKIFNARDLEKQEVIKENRLQEDLSRQWIKAIDRLDKNMALTHKAMADLYKKLGSIKRFKDK